MFLSTYFKVTSFRFLSSIAFKISLWLSGSDERSKTLNLKL
jgi:hypothetical protein